MSILGKVFGSASAQPIEAVGNVLDKLFTSKEEKLDKQALLERLKMEPQIAQIELNKLEAQHRSIFVAGWRPFIGWVCGSALAYNFIFRDLLAWALNIYDASITPPPQIIVEHLITILMALLGLGAMRTAEKFGGRTK